MPARGRHRRYRPGLVSRASLTVTASGAGIALPLVSAGVVQGAPEDPERTAQAERTSQTRQQAEPGVETAAHAETRPSSATPAERPESASYEVAGGDTLSSIAREHDVDDGWHGLYERNRRVVGGDPDLIFPGQRLSLEDRPEKPRKQSRKKADPDPPEQRAAPQKEKKPEPRDPAPEPPAPSASAPVAGVETGTPYRAAGSGWSSGYHTGVDFPVPTGTTVKAVAGGSVESAGWAGAYGYQVVLRHDDGRYSQYAHLSAISVADGQRVGAGQRVGRSGSTGNSTGPHLHFEVRSGPGYGSDIDPLAYLRALGVTV